MSTVIVFASKYGCTEELATRLKELINDKVDLCNIKETSSIQLDKYDKIIIGGSVYMGKIQKQVKEFCSKYKEELLQKKIGLFISCMQQGEKSKNQLESNYDSDLLSKALVKESFGGKINYKKMKKMDRFITKMVSKADENAPKLDIDKEAVFINEAVINKFAGVMNND